MRIKIELKGKLVVNNQMDGETIETKIERITTMKEPITDGAPLIYTEREDGIMPSYDIRTDRFDVAIDATDVIAKSNTAKRDKRIADKKNVKEVNIVESTQATE